MKIGTFIEGKSNNLNLMRLMAALAVPLSHSYNFTNQLSSEPLLKLTGNLTMGYLAVFVFFVISGLLITRSFDNAKNVRQFIFARFFRIYPALIFALLISVFLIGACYTSLPLHDYLHHPQIWRYLAENLTFQLNGDLPGVFQTGKEFSTTVNGSIWSLHFEVYAYFLIFIAGLCGLISNRAAFNTLAIVLILVYAKAPVGFVLIPAAWDAPFYVPMLGFLAGSIVYVNRDQLPGTVIWLVIAILTYCIFRHHVWVHLIFSAMIGYAVLIIGFNPALNLKINIKNDYSYGIYVYSFPIQQALMHSFDIDSPWVLFAACMCISLPLSMASWHLLEKPALRLKSVFGH